MTWTRYDRRNTGRWGDVFGAISMGITSKGKEGFMLRVLMAEAILRKISQAAKPRLALEFGDGEHAGQMRIVEDMEFGFTAFKTGAKTARWLLPFPLHPQFVAQRVKMQRVEDLEFPAPGIAQGRVPAKLLKAAPVAAPKINGSIMSGTPALPPSVDQVRKDAARRVLG